MADVLVKQLVEAGVHFGHRGEPLEPEDGSLYLRPSEAHSHYRRS